MIKEDFVPFEVAGLLKENGFDEYCFLAYDKDGSINDAMELYGEFEVCNSECYEDDIAAPTFQMAMKWLREEKHIYIQIMLDSFACGGRSGYYVVLQKTDSDYERMLSDFVETVFYETYEEAALDAIKICLTELL